MLKASVSYEPVKFTCLIENYYQLYFQLQIHLEQNDILCNMSYNLIQQFLVCTKSSLFTNQIT